MKCSASFVKWNVLLCLTRNQFSSAKFHFHCANNSSKTTEPYWQSIERSKVNEIPLLIKRSGRSIPDGGSAVVGALAACWPEDFLRAEGRNRTTLSLAYKTLSLSFSLSLSPRAQQVVHAGG